MITGLQAIVQTVQTSLGRTTSPVCMAVLCWRDLQDGSGNQAAVLTDVGDAAQLDLPAGLDGGLREGQGGGASG